MTSCKKHLVLVWAKKENGEEGISMYGSFSVANETNLYRLTYNSTLIKGIESFEFVDEDGITDNTKSINGMSFSTKERENDVHPEGKNCAADLKGGFWYSGCGNLFLFKDEKIRWYTFAEYSNDIKEIEIMIKEQAY